MKWLRVFLLSLLEFTAVYVFTLNLVMFLSSLVGYNIIFPNVYYDSTSSIHDTYFGYSSLLLAIQDYPGAKFDDLLRWGGDLLDTLTGPFFTGIKQAQTAKTEIGKIVLYIKALFDWLMSGAVQPILFTARLINILAELGNELVRTLGWLENILLGKYNVGLSSGSCLTDDTCVSSEYLWTTLQLYMS